MYMGLFNKKDEKELIILIDIRSSGIGGSIIELSINQKPNILYTKRSKIYFKEPQDSDSFVESMHKTLKEVVIDLQTNGVKQINQSIKNNIPIYVIYSSPWFMSETKNIHLQKTKPFLFTKDTLDKIISKEISFKKEESIERIESDITHVVINGYEITNPYKKKITEIDLSIYVSAISKQTHKEVNFLIKTYFNTKNIIHRSNMLMNFTTLRNIFSHTRNFTYVDVGGEITDIGIVEQNRLVHIISIPIGYHMFIRQLSNDLNLDEPQARSAIETINKNVSVGNEKTQKIISETGTKWANAVTKSISNITHTLPRNVFINSDFETGNFFSNIIKNMLFDHDDDTSTPSVNMIVMSHEHINHLFTYAKDVKRDTFIELQTIFLDSLIKND